jgi:hypothetical protein
VRAGGELAPHVQRRFDRALEVGGHEAPIVCLSAGTVHTPPPLNSEGYPWHESVAGAAYLLSRGVPSERIQVEAISYDTVGNAYFAKLLHVDPAGWHDLIVITSEFHMPRSRAIFEWVFGLTPGRYQMRFEATSNEGMPAVLLQRRTAKERAALEALQPTMHRIRDLRTLHSWIYSEHKAYTAQGWTSRKASAPDIAEIY